MSIRRMSTSTMTLQQRFPTMSTGTKVPIDVTFVVVGGGGAGGGSGGSFRSASGGGAGGYQASVSGEPSGGGDSALPVLNGVFSPFQIIVGAGGPADVSGSRVGDDGQNSFLGDIVSIGGGGGGQGSDTGGTGRPGGSGGGSNSSNPGGSGEPGQGFDGGTRGERNQGSGGGGAAGPAPAVSGTAEGIGGPGVSSSITGSAVSRANGGHGSPTSETEGGVNTGDGGASRAQTSPGFAGGSGVVIFGVETGTPVSFTAGVTETSSTVGSLDVYTVTAAGPTDEVTIG